MFICVINVGKRSVACHCGSDWQVLSSSDAVISQPLCSLLQVSEMMLAIIGEFRRAGVGAAHASVTIATSESWLYTLCTPQTPHQKNKKNKACCN